MIAEVKSVLEVTDLSRRFGRTVALDSVNLDVRRGVVFGLVGENGAGKTTLIKHLLSLFKGADRVGASARTRPGQGTCPCAGPGRLSQRGS